MTFLEKIIVFWKPAFLVLRGATIAQLIPIVGYIFLAKIIGTVEFGIFSIWLGFVYLGSILSTLRLENSLVIENDGFSRDKSFLICSLTVLISSLIFLLVILFFLAIQIPFFKNLPTLSWFLLIPSLAFLAFNTTLQSLAAADGDYVQLNRLRIIQSTSAVLIQLVMVYFNSDAISLMLGFLGGQII